MTKSARRFRSVICGILSFFLALAIVLLSVLGVVKLTLLNPAYTSYICKSSGYTQATWEELKEEFVNYGAACNIEESFFDGVFEDIITPFLITDYTTNSVKAFYNNTQQGTASTELIENKLLEALKRYAEEKGYVINDPLVENLKVISTEMCEIYSVYADMFNTSYFATASNMLSRYMPLFNWALIGIGIFTLLAIIVIRLFFRRAKNYLRFYIYATSAATLMLAIGPAIALIMRIGSRINIANASLYYLASGFINDFFIVLLIAAAVMAVITIILALIRNWAVKRNR